MNIQQALLPKSSANGFARRIGDREGGARVENKVQSGKPNQGRIQTTGAPAGAKTGDYESSSHDRLVYLTTCLIGHMVEVHVKNGSIYTGLFHATDPEHDFGIILKMARLIKDGTLQGNKAVTEFVSKAPTKILIIPAKELVQVIAKDVSVTSDGFASELQHEKHQELLIDSVISQSRNVGLERELERWVPDEDYPQCPELDNIFSGSRNRSWDQFEINQKLFGVKSTFNEEFYTTKLEKGPKLRELEREAMRIAREIEGEETQDLHLAEERGLDVHDNFDIDEETRYSSVYRCRVVDDSGYEEEEDIMLDSHNIDTFGDSSGSLSRGPADFTSLQSSIGVRLSSSTSLVDEAPSSQAAIGSDLSRTGFNDQAKQLASEISSDRFSLSDSESRIQDKLPGECGGSSDSKEFAEKPSTSQDLQMPKSIDSQPLFREKLNAPDKARSYVNSTAEAQSISKVNEKPSSYSGLLEGPTSSKVTGERHSVNSHGQRGSSTSSNSDRFVAVSASSGPGLSPSSTMGSLSSEKSTLNPHAKEFKLNPNAKSFKPYQTSVRPPSPVSDGSFYYQTQGSPVPHMHMPVNFGIGPSFPGHQPVVFSQQVAPMQSPQAYFHPTGPQYGQQQMLLRQRQVMYYQPEMQYKGRDY